MSVTKVFVVFAFLLCACGDELRGGPRAQTNAADATAIPVAPLTPAPRFHAAQVVNVPQSGVELQPVGNCSNYAMGSLVESLYLQATGETYTLSKAYISYWTWFEKIVQDGWEGGSLNTGATFDTNRWVLLKRGMMHNSSFIPEEAGASSSPRTSAALDYINQSLAYGALSTPENRQNRALVRQELNYAFGLSEPVVSLMDWAFGSDASQNYWSHLLAPWTRGTALVAAEDMPARYSASPDRAPEWSSLERALLDFRYVPYEVWDGASYREYYRRIQRALHNSVPVVVDWNVDYSSEDVYGRWLDYRESDGVHETVTVDYQIDNVPGYGTLYVGWNYDWDALNAALDEGAHVTMLREKGSWGQYGYLGTGYHDLYTDGYLDRALIGVHMPVGY